MSQQDVHLNPSEERAESGAEDKHTLIIGCGNVLLGDDGFGPCVIKELAKSALPDEVGLIDAGTGIRKILFNLVLGGAKPRKMIIVDAIDLAGKKAGEVFEVPLDAVPAQKKEDFSVHHLPTTNMLLELKTQCQVEVKIIAAQVSGLPSEMKCGLSAPLQSAVKKAVELILKELGGKQGNTPPTRHRP